MSLKSSVRDWFIRREINKQKEEGNMLSGLWKWLDGNKTVFGAALDLLTSIAIALPQILPAFGLEVAVIANVTSKLTIAIGLGHKLYKWYYKE